VASESGASPGIRPDRPRGSVVTGTSQVDAPPRRPDDIVRDLEAERVRLRTSVDMLKDEVDAFRERVKEMIPKIGGAAGGALGGLIVLRWMIRRRKKS
jgi:hypothetical protein